MFFDSIVASFGFIPYMNGYTLMIIIYFYLLIGIVYLGVLTNVLIRYAVIRFIGRKNT